MGVVTYSARLLFEKYTPLNNPAILAICLAILVVSYLGATFIIDRKSIMELRQFLKDVRNSEQGEDEGKIADGNTL